MKIIFDASFDKSLSKISLSASVKLKIEELIFVIESAKFISEVPKVIKMQGFQTFYRLRIGDYRIGIELEPENVIRFIIIAHRKDIYRFFP